MSDLVDPEMIQKIVGAPRHQTEHIARVVEEDMRIYILHSVECVESGLKDLRACRFSRALDRGVRDAGQWPKTPMIVKVEGGRLTRVQQA